MLCHSWDVYCPEDRHPHPALSDERPAHRKYLLHVKASHSRNDCQAINSKRCRWPGWHDLSVCTSRTSNGSQTGTMDLARWANAIRTARATASRIARKAARFLKNLQPLCPKRHCCRSRRLTNDPPSQLVRGAENCFSCERLRSAIHGGRKPSPRCSV